MEELESKIICLCALKIRLPNGDLIKCSKKKGANLPFPIPYLENQEVCVGIIFNEESKHVIPERKTDILRMYHCPYREYKNN